MENNGFYAVKQWRVCGGKHHVFTVIEKRGYYERGCDQVPGKFLTIDAARAAAAAAGITVDKLVNDLKIVNL